MNCFYINNNRGLFFTKSASPFEITIPKDVLSHLEIVNAQKLDELLSKFIETKKITPSQIFIILGKNTTFEKDITDIARTERYIEIQKFLDIVPFEKTLNKIFKIQKKEKIVAANRDFCQKLIDVFTKLGFSVEAIIPETLFSETLPVLVKKIDTLKQYNLLDSHNRASSSANTSSQPFLQNTRLIILASVFAILIITLIFMVYTKYFTFNPKIKAPTVRVKQPIIRILTSPQASFSATPSGYLKK